MSQAASIGSEITFKCLRTHKSLSLVLQNHIKRSKVFNTRLQIEYKAKFDVTRYNETRYQRFPDISFPVFNVAFLTLQIPIFQTNQPIYSIVLLLKSLKHLTPVHCNWASLYYKID